jgi:hypothetical protein
MLHDSECIHLGRDGDVTLQLTKRPRRAGRRAAARSPTGYGRRAGSHRSSARCACKTPQGRGRGRRVESEAGCVLDP